MDPRVPDARGPARAAPPPPGPPDDPPERRARPALRTLVVLVVLGVAVHVVLPQLTTLRHSVDVLRSWVWWASALAVLAQAASYAGSGALLQAAVRLVGGRLRLGEAVAIAMGSASLGLLWGGQVTVSGATARWLRARGVPAEGAVLAGVLPPALNALTIVAVAAAGLLALVARHALPAGVADAFGVAVGLLAAGAGALAVGLRDRSRVLRMLHAADRVWCRVRRRPYKPEAVEAAVARLASAGRQLRGGGWRRPALGDAANVGFDLLTLALLFVAAGHPVGPAVLLAGYGPPLLLSKLSVLPGGVGVVEGGMVALYAVAGVPRAVMVLVVLGYRLLSFWAPVLIGFPLALILDHKAR